MSDEDAARLAAIKERVAAATPGRWRWRGNLSSKGVELRAILSGEQRTPRFKHGSYTVMDFVRWGFQSATPRFLDPEHIMRPPQLIPSAPHNDWDIVAIDHPDARFIEHSREDVEWLLGEVERLGEIAESWHLLEAHTRTCGVVCWWDDGQLCFQEAPKTAGEFKDAARAERAREGARANGH